jgi:coenzyme F420-dependent glucose-6-phosphate dehydrogenase
VDLGYHLSSEEHGARALVRHAAAAEQRGFTYATISDHFHPWLPQQGESPFVWGVLGALAEATERLHLTTAVTCPTIRMHPAIVAHAAATAAALLDGRFALGLGSGENLNEHVLGDRWPRGGERLDMLEEAIHVIRALLSGEQTSHRGTHYTVEEARLYTLPDEPPAIVMAASGARATAMAGEIADGLISISADADQVEAFAAGDPGDDPRPRYGKLDVCHADDVETARELVLSGWGNAGLGPAGAELRTPGQFEALLANIDDDAVVSDVVLGPDPGPYRERIAEFADAGFTHVILHQIGPDQEPFLDFAAEALLDAA